MTQNKYDVAIIGGGISGLSALHFLKHKKPSYTVKLFEADSRLGGTIGTDHIDGFSLDWGPNGFLDREPLTLQMVDQINLTNSLERANDNVENRFILRAGKLRPVPMSPPKFITSDILPISGRLRVMMEPFAKARPADIDESVYDFVKRRIGVQAADYLVQPMVSGVYGGVADRLSLQSCFPIMREMEDEYGSLFKAMIHKAKKAKAEKKKSGSPSGPGGWLTSFTGGLSKIIEQFQEKYQNDIMCNQTAIKIIKTDKLYKITFENGNEVFAHKVIVATPTYKAADLVSELSQSLAQTFNSIPYAPISVICLGYKKENITHNLDGFGFLVPKKENLKILGSIWTSSIFSHRAPNGMVQFRTMVGGDGDHESINLSDDALLDAVQANLDAIVGINGKPTLTKIYRWSRGIPQFKIGHAKIMDKLEKELTQQGNLFITGNAYYGISLNDCIKQSYKVVEQI